MSFFNTMGISASALTAQQLRMDIISENLANVNTTKTANGQPYRRKVTLFEEKVDSFSTFFSDAVNNLYAPGLQRGSGVRVSKIVEDTSPGSKVYEPEHPDADADGYVTMPNVNVVSEMVNMISASRSYEANITAMNITKALQAKTLEISK